MSQEKLMWSEENIDILKHLVKECDGGRFMVALGKDSQKNHIYLKRCWDAILLDFKNETMINITKEQLKSKWRRLTIDPVKNAYRKSVELAQQKGATYNEKLVKFSKQMKNYHLAQKTTGGGSPPRPPTPPSPDNYSHNPKYDLLPLHSPNVVSYPNEPEIEPEKEKPRYRRPQIEPEKEKPRDTRPQIEPEKEKPRDKRPQIESGDLLSTACKSLFFEDENPPAILTSQQIFLDENSSWELSTNATSSGPFQDDNSRLTSRTVNPVKPVVAEKSVNSSRKGGEGRRVGEEREELCNESKKLLKRKAEIMELEHIHKLKLEKEEAEEKKKTQELLRTHAQLLFDKKMEILVSIQKSIEVIFSLITEWSFDGHLILFVFKEF